MNTFFAPEVALWRVAFSKGKEEAEMGTGYEIVLALRSWHFAYFDCVTGCLVLPGYLWKSFHICHSLFAAVSYREQMSKTFSRELSSGHLCS